MGIIEDIAKYQNSEEYLSAPLERKIQANAYYNSILRQSPEYAQTPYESRKIIEKQVLSNMPGYDPALVQGDDAESNRVRELYTQAEAIKTGQSDLNIFDGIVEGGRGWLSGKVATAFVDIFTEGDTRDAMYGDRTSEAEDYRDYLAEINDPEGMTDYKVAKVVGNILGFGADAAAMAAAYGSLGAPGVVAKLFGTAATPAGSSVFASALTKAGFAKVAAYAAPVAKQALIEGIGYVGEELIADIITKQMDTNKEIEEFVKDIPSKFGKGLMYFAFGESVGFGLSGALKGIGKVATPSGARNFTLGQVKNLDGNEAARGFMAALQNPGKTPEELHSLIGGHFSLDEVKVFQQNAIDGQLLADATSGKVDLDKVEEASFRLFKGMDTEVNGDVVKIKSFANKPLKQEVIVKNNAELHEFYKVQGAHHQSYKLEVNRKWASNDLQDLKLQVISKEAKGTTLSVADTADMFGIGAGSKQFDLKQYEDIAEKVLGKDADIKIIGVDKLPAKKVGLNEKIIYVPKTVMNSRQANQFAENFFGQLEQASYGRIKVNMDTLSSVIRSASDVRYTPEFLGKQLKKLGGKYRTLKSGEIEVLLRGESTVYSNIVQAGAGVHSSQYSLESLQNILYRKKKIKISQDPETGKILIQKATKNSKPVAYESLKEVFMDKTLRPGLPYEQRDKFLHLIGDEIDATKPDKGNIKALSEKIKEYEQLPSNTQEVYVKNTKKINKIPVLDSYRVTLGESGLAKDFSTLDEAHAWLNKDFDKFTNLQDEAYDRGWRMQYNKSGGYTLLTPDKMEIQAKSIREAQRVMANVEDVFNTPELMDATAMATFKQEVPLVEQANKIVQEQMIKAAEKNINYKGRSASRVKQFLSEWLVPMRDRIEQIGDIEATKLFDKLSTAYKMGQSHNANVDMWVESLLHGKGRKFNTTQLNNMGDILMHETDRAEWIPLAKKMGITLEPSQIQVMETLSDGMAVAGKMFGIDNKDWIKNYWTRLGKMTEEDAAKMLERSTGGNAQSYFKHFRTQDLVAGRLQNNIEHVFKTYMYLGNREKYLGGVIGEIDAVIKKGELHEDSLRLLKEVKEKALGGTFSSEQAKRATSKMLTNKARSEKIASGEIGPSWWTPEKRIKMAQQELNKDYVRYATDLSTAAVMSGKMTLPIRNVSQINTVLMPMAGPENVVTAMKHLGNSTEFMAERYLKDYNKGIIKPRAGMSYDHGSVMNLVRNWNHVGLNNFYNSDDFTRLIASLSAENAFRNGQALLKSGEIDLEGFLKITKADYLREADTINFTELVTNGQLKSAESFLQRRWAEMTMFEYENIAKPEKLSSGFGKLLGQFSTYPLSLAQFMRRGLAAEKGWFAAKLMMGTSSTAFFYSEVMGMEGLTNGNPMENILFTGGPVLSFGAQTITNVKNLAYKPSLGGFENIGKDVAKTFTPGYGMSKRFIDGINAFKEGEFAAGSVNMLGGSYNEDRLINKF